MSGVYTLALSSVVLSSSITGISITATKRYRPQIWICWALNIVGFGLMSTTLATDPLGKSVGCLLLLGLGSGCVVSIDRELLPFNSEASIHGSGLNASFMYPIVAPLSVTQNAPALAFMWFLAAFAGVGIPTSFLPHNCLLTSWCDLIYYRSGVSRSEAPSSRTSSRRSFLRPFSSLSHKGLSSCTRSSQSSPCTLRKLGSRSKSRLRRVLRCCGKSWPASVVWDLWRHCS